MSRQTGMLPSVLEMDVEDQDVIRGDDNLSCEERLVMRTKSRKRNSLPILRGLKPFSRMFSR